MSDYNVGNAHGTVTIDSSGIDASLQNAQRGFRNLTRDIGGGMQRVGGSISGVGTKLSMLTLPLVAVGTGGLRTAMQFDTAMNAISARTGLTGEKLEEVKQLSMDMGAATVFSSQQSADAMLQMLTAGMDVEQAMAALPNVLNAAAASGADLGTSADLVTNIMSSFSLTAEDTTDIVENMSRAAASSPADMLEMGVALQRLGGMASNMGISVNEASATLAILANNGIRGEAAATQLRSMLLNMQQDTPGVSAAWEKLGTSLFDADGKARDLNDVFEEMKVAMADMSEEEKSAIITDLAGSYGMTAMNALLAGESIESMQEKMGDQSSAAEVAAARMDTFEGVITSLKGSVETFMITTLLPFMNNVLKPLGEQAIVLVNSFTAWANAHPQLVGQIMGLLAVLTMAGPTLFFVGKMISILGGIIGFVLSPIGLLAAGIAAIVYAFQDALAPLSKIGDIFVGFYDRMMMAFDAGGIGRAVDFFFARIGGVLKSALNVLGSIFLDIGGQLVSALPAILSALGDLANWVYNSIILPLVNGLSGYATDFYNAVVEYGPEILRGIAAGIIDLAVWANEKVVTPIATALSGYATDFYNAVVEYGPEILRGIAAGIIDLTNWVWDNIISPVIDALTGAASDPALATQATAVGKNIVASIANGFIEIGTMIYENLIVPLGEELQRGLESVLGEFGTKFLTTMIGVGIALFGVSLAIGVFASAWTAVKTAIIAAKAVLMGFNWPIALLVLAITAAILFLDEFAKKLGFAGVIEMLQSTFDTWKGIVDQFGTIIQETVDSWFGIFDMAWTIIKNTVIGILDEISAALGFEDATELLQTALDGLEAIFSLSFAAIDGIVDGVVKTVEGIVGALNDVYTAAMTLLGLSGGGGGAPVTRFGTTPETSGTTGDGHGWWSDNEWTGSSSPWQTALGLLNPNGDAAGTPWTGDMGINTPTGRTTHGQEGVIPARQRGGLRVYPGKNGATLEGLGEMLAAMVQSMSMPAIPVATADAGGSGGGGNNYYLTVEVPLEVLRDEPNLAANAERLGETIMKNIRGQS
jgi:TP901 family phage tail tape measure protein